MDKILAALTPDEKDALIKRLCWVINDLLDAPSPEAVLTVYVTTTLSKRGIDIIETQTKETIDAALASALAVINKAKGP